MLCLADDDPLAVAALAAIQSGAVEELAKLLRAEPRAATMLLRRAPRGNDVGLSYPLIAAAVDWPGRFPRVVDTIGLLVASGADVRVPCEGRHRETALHWAASCDDVAALDALLDAGADIEAPGAVIAGGTALDDAVAFSQWRTARRLFERGAQMAVWHAAALGQMEQVESYFAAGGPTAKHPWGAYPPSAAIHVAFWCACHGGQRGAAEWLLARGADANWVAAWDGLTPLDTARRNGHAELVAWLESVGARARHG